MIILHQIFLHTGIAKRVMMQDGHHHEDHVGEMWNVWGLEIPLVHLHWVNTSIETCMD